MPMLGHERWRPKEDHHSKHKANKPSSTKPTFSSKRITIDFDIGGWYPLGSQRSFYLEVAQRRWPYQNWHQLYKWLYDQNSLVSIMSKLELVHFFTLKSGICMGVHLDLIFLKVQTRNPKSGWIWAVIHLDYTLAVKENLDPVLQSS